MNTVPKTKGVLLRERYEFKFWEYGCKDGKAEKQNKEREDYKRC